MNITNELNWRQLIKKIINPNLLNTTTFNEKESICIHFDSSTIESLSFKIITKIILLNILINKYKFLIFAFINDKNLIKQYYSEVKKIIEKHCNVKIINSSELEKIKIHFLNENDLNELTTQNKTDCEKRFILIDELNIGNNIYIDKTTSTYKMYKFLLSQNDEQLEKLYKKATLLTENEINAILDFHNKQVNLKYGQQRLAETIMNFLYTNDSYKESKRIDLCLTKNTFNELSHSDLKQILTTTNLYAIKDKQSLLAFFMENDIINSITEFYKLMKEKSIVVNNEVIHDKNYKMIYNKSLLNGYFFIKKNKFDLYIGKIGK